MQPLVSVIMPAYNAEKYLDESLRSLINQTFDNWELIVTNDGSTDSTEKILQSYQDPRIKIISQPNKGVSAARNRGLEMMQGKYFTFLDADDRLTAQSLELRVSFAEQHPDTDIIAGAVNFFSDKGIQRTWHPDFNGDPFPLFIRNDERVFCNPALFIKRKPSVIYKFTEGMTHVEDLLFFTTITQQQKHQYDHIPDVVYEYRVSGNSAMSNLKDLENGYWTFYDTVKKMHGVKATQKNYLKWRIMRIMFLSYIAGKRYGSAFSMISKVFK